MKFQEFMNENYPELELKPPLFYNWDIGIRFALGEEEEFDCPNNLYAFNCYKRAFALFESLHSPEEELFIVMDVNDFDKGRKLKHQLRNFPSYVSRPILYRLKHTVLPYLFPDEDEEGLYKTHRFTLACKTFEIKYVPLLKAICNQDLALNPKLFHRVYFINTNRKTVFHVYDDRGCDLLATSPDSIWNVYKRCNEWILDYDRPAIDQMFNK